MSVVLYAVGDVLVNREEPASAFALTQGFLSQADLRFCQLENIFIEEEKSQPSPTYRAAKLGLKPPRINNAEALKQAHFDIVSMAGNHCLDWGYPGLLRTMELVKNTDAIPIGVGKNLEEARQPAIVERNGVKMAFLSRNSILPTNYWATSERPGCAPLRALTFYEPIEYDQPGQPCRIHTFCQRDDLSSMREDIKKVRDQVDIVIMSLHYGLHFVPAKLADYQREASYAAIDAGADIVLGHHAHIIKGIEVYKGKVIFYSLCNFVLDSAMRSWPNISAGTRELMETYKWEIDPEWVKTYPLPADSRKTFLVKCVIAKDGIQKVSFFPVMINQKGQPEIVKRDDERSTAVIDYVKWCSESEKLPVKFSREGDEVVVLTK